MRIKPSEITVNPDDPFANDKLSRLECAKALTSIILKLKSPVVISINGTWGTGKTTFLRMWKEYLKTLKFPVILFNAWQNDFCDDALIALLGEIGAAIENFGLSPEIKEQAKEFFERTKKVGSALAKRGIPIVAQAVAQKIIGEGATDQIGNVFSETVGNLAKNQIANYQKSKKIIDGFKSHLSEFANTVGKQEDGGSLPLVIIIDELDRCRPLFAIEVLERAKHLFDIDSIVFVLGIDREQLEYSIKTIYGMNMNVQGYLMRFIDLNFNLPKPSTEQYSKLLFERLELNEYFAGRKGVEDKDCFITIFSKLFHIFNLSLREQEHCFAMLSLATAITGPSDSLISVLLSIMIFLKLKNPSLYLDFLEGHKNADDILDFIASKPGGNEFVNSHAGRVIEAYLLKVSPEKWAERRIRHYTEIAAGKLVTLTNFPTWVKIKNAETAKHIVELLGDRNILHLSTSALKYISKKIELAELFR